MDLLTRLFGTPQALRRWMVANLVANCGIVLTGGLVRLTGSGLGCSEWPRCTPDSYVALPATGMHGAIEFGNRLLTFVLILIAVGALVAAIRSVANGTTPRHLRMIAIGVLVGIPFQGVIGGFTVWSGLNPYVVALHLLLSVLLISLCTWMVRIAYRARPTIESSLSVSLSRVAYVLTWIVIWLGTVTTGSGPHAGDGSAPRTGLPLLEVARVHAASVWLLVACTVVLVWLLRSRAAYLMLGTMVLQGAIGYAQYFTGLPRWMVALHLLGLCIAMITATNLMLSVRRADDPVTEEHEPRVAAATRKA